MRTGKATAALARPSVHYYCPVYTVPSKHGDGANQHNPEQQAQLSPAVSIQLSPADSNMHHHYERLKPGQGRAAAHTETHTERQTEEWHSAAVTKRGSGIHRTRATYTQRRKPRQGGAASLSLSVSLSVCACLSLSLPAPIGGVVPTTHAQQDGQAGCRL